MKNNMNQASYDGKASFFFFLTFLRHKIDQDRTKQTHIARAVSVRPEYINRVYRGRQTCSVDVQERICHFFGISYLEALAIGRQLVETGEMPSTKPALAAPSPPTVASKNIKDEDQPTETDVIAIVSQWVAQKKETEDNLARLQNILEAFGDGLAILDTDLRIEYQNRAHRELFGASLVGQPCYFAHGREKHLDFCPSYKARRTGMPASSVIPFAGRAFSVLTTPIRNMSGQITGYAEALRDITDIQNTLAMTKAALDMSDRAVFIAKIDRTISYFNAKLRELTGAEEHDLISTGIFLHYLQENGICRNSAELAEAIKKAWKDNKEFTMPVRFSNGANYLFTCRPIHSNEMYIGRIGAFTPA